MKKYISGLLAIVFAIGLSAFTAKEQTFSMNFEFDDNVSSNPTADGNADGVADLTEALKPGNYKAYIGCPEGYEYLCGIDAASMQTLVVNGNSYSRPVIQSGSQLYSEISAAVNTKDDGELVELKQ
ncbi:MAG TPA: hypothetical protein VGD17_14205 [Chitinophagaceae bacterium]